MVDTVTNERTQRPRCMDKKPKCSIKIETYSNKTKQFFSFKLHCIVAFLLCSFRGMHFEIQYYVVSWNAIDLNGIARGKRRVDVDEGKAHGKNATYWIFSSLQDSIKRKLFVKYLNKSKNS